MAFTLQLGATAPGLKLQATDGNIYQLTDFADTEVLVLSFTCNHCPYVTGSDEITRQTAYKFDSQGVRFVYSNIF